MSTVSLLAGIFTCFLKIGLFSFGGGYAMVPLIQHEVVAVNHWMSIEECVDLIAVSGMGPGPIATNSATIIGFRVGGVWGAIAGTVGVVLPSFIIASLLTALLVKYRGSRAVSRVMVGIRPIIISLIGTAAFVVAPSAVSDWQTAAISGVCFILLIKTRVHPILVLLASGLAGVILFL